MKIVRDSATPTLDPTKEESYRFLDKFIAEMTTIFPAPYIHIGADENNGVAWKNNPGIVQYMKDKGIADTYELQAYFVKRMYDIAKKHHRTIIGWEELYTHGLPKDVVVQAWIVGGMGFKSADPDSIAIKGNPVLISTGFYLDLFMPAHIYYQNPNLPALQNKNIWGGEAALWSELVDDNTFEGRAWPRAAAIAERLWSPENINNVEDMYRRLFVLDDRLKEAGLNDRLNIYRMLGQMGNGQDITADLTILQTLAPLKGLKRIISQTNKPAGLKYENTPLINLADMVSSDSKQAWEFRKLVENYISSKDSVVRKKIETKLNQWQQAALQIPLQINNAPNLKVFEIYASKIAMAT